MSMQNRINEYSNCDDHDQKVSLSPHQMRRDDGMRVKDCSGYGEVTGHQITGMDPLDIPILAFRNQLEFTHFVVNSLNTSIYLYCIFFLAVNYVNVSFLIRQHVDRSNSEVSAGNPAGKLILFLILFYLSLILSLFSFVSCFLDRLHTLGYVQIM